MNKDLLKKLGVAGAILVLLGALAYFIRVTPLQPVEEEVIVEEEIVEEEVVEEEVTEGDAEESVSTEVEVIE